MKTRTAVLTVALSIAPFVAYAQKAELAPVPTPIGWQALPTHAATPTVSRGVWAAPAQATPAWGEIVSPATGVHAPMGTSETPAVAARASVAPARRSGRLALSIAVGAMSPSYWASGTSRTHLPPVAELAFLLGSALVRTSSSFSLTLGYQLETTIDPTAVLHRHELGLALRKSWFFTVVGLGGGLLHTFDGRTAPIASLTARPGFEIGATGLFVAAPWSLDVVIDDGVTFLNAFGLAVGWQHI